MTHDKFDIVIVGSGFVGAALACALEKLPLKIAVLERAPRNFEITDQRSIVLSYGSSLILKAINVWPALKSRTTPIRTLQLSEAGHFGMANISAEEEKVDALGYVIDGGFLQKTLLNQLPTLKNVTYFRPASVLSMTEENAQWNLQIEGEEGQFQLSAKLVVAADGTNSTVRRLQNIAATEFDYEQMAIVSTIGLRRPHHHIAYERFTSEGAIAFLPQPDFHCGLVWSAPQEIAKELMELSDDVFLQKLQKKFGYRLGKFIEVQRRFAYPLKLTKSTQQAGKGWVLIGNAAHTLHPIAAQGFNLGLRDVASLVEVIQKVVEQQQDFFSDELTQQYLSSRQRDQNRTVDFTHKMVRIFSHDIWPVRAARGLVTTAIEYLPFIKHRVARQAMGLIKKP